jgi:hypothetical protein
MRLLDDSGYDGLVLVDPAAYEKHTATVGQPFWLPENQLLPTSLDEALDQQLVAGAAVALTPTKYIAAGDTDALKSAARQVKQLGRSDVIFVAPLDIALLDRSFIRQTTAILSDVGCPVALVMGRQFDPLQHAAARIIPNLRLLAATVDLMPIRTDFNAFDLVAHGAFAGAIGTGGSIRHTVDPTDKPKSILRPRDDTSPSVLFPEFVCWWRGSRIAKLYGARAAARCPCAVCEERQLNRFVRRSDQNEAMAHAVATWSGWANDMLEAQTMAERAQYWQTLCRGSIMHHKHLAVQLRRREPIKPQRPIEVWANLPAWSVSHP